MTRLPSLALLASTLLTSLGPAAARDRAPSGPCIDLDQVVSQQPAGPAAIDFQLTGKRTFRNTLASECPNLGELNRFRQIVWDNRDGRRVCPGDRFRLIETTQARAVGAGSFPFCRLGSFTQVTR
jgi:hypothetical protein